MSANNIPTGCSITNLQAMAESITLCRYNPHELSNSPQHIQPYQKCQSAEKPNFNSTLRQTTQIKRYRHHKNIESRPISVTTYNQNSDFLMGPSHSEHLQPAPSTFGRMMPFNSSSWVNNNKKLQKKWLADKQGFPEEFSPNKKKRTSKPFFESAQVCGGDLKEYFQSMKQYFNNSNSKFFQKRVPPQTIFSPAKKKMIENKDNLNIRQIRPFTHNKAKRTNTLTQIEQFNSPNKDYYSTNFITKVSPQKHKLSSNNGVRDKAGAFKSEITIFKRRPVNYKQEFHYIFGGFKGVFLDEEVQKLKNLYYRDFLWKIALNRGFTYEAQPVARYYLGKGNNSRLIRRIMGKRSWWVEDSRPENAIFIWTQLKIYDMYKKQETTNKEQQEINKEQQETINKEQSLEGQNSEKIGKEDVPQEEILNVKPNENKGDKNRFILNRDRYSIWRSYIKVRNGQDKRPQEDMSHRKIPLKTMKIPNKITNHIQFSRVIGNKKALYRTMSAYFAFKQIDSYQYLPLTFHITGGLEDDQYLRFLRDYYKLSKDGVNCWIVKPGQLSNRGHSIKFCNSLPDIKKQIKQRKINDNGSVRTYILQAYIDRPLLYQGRKFDLRHYLMITSTEGKIRGYFYEDGYVRTTSMPYSLETTQAGVHLTNDAVQKYLPQYGKYEKANKLSYKQLHQYMLKINPSKGFYQIILPQIKAIVTHIIQASFPFIDPNRRINNFQIFGIDIMIDQNYKCWLIEVNTNPCIEVNCKVLAQIIPQMLDNALAIGVDSIVWPVSGKLKTINENMVELNKFQLVFDEEMEGQSIMQHYRDNKIQLGNYGDDDQNYQSCEQDCT